MAPPRDSTPGRGRTTGTPATPGTSPPSVSSRALRPLRRVTLPGGRTLTIRPLTAADSDSLVLLYATLNEEDLYRRFFSGRPPPDTFVARMACAQDRGGFGLVATVEGPGAVPGRLVAEATYELLPNGDGELGITVAAEARGWLGPYLLDALVEQAAARGVPNLEADVLVTNRRMLTMLANRGFVVLDHDEQPATVRVAIGTARRVPSWPGTHHTRPRLLVEVPGGRWHAEGAARRAGFQVLACPGPRRGWSHCPALQGEPCPLVTGADVVVHTGSAEGAETSQSLLRAHHRLHGSIPLCIELPPEAGDGGTGAVRLSRDADDEAVVGVLELLARRLPGAEGEPGTEPPGPPPPPEPTPAPGDGTGR